MLYVNHMEIPIGIIISRKNREFKMESGEWKVWICEVIIIIHFQLSILKVSLQ